MKSAPARYSYLKINPPIGRMPVLQNLGLDELDIDPAYQRSCEGGGSQSLIRAIAQDWNWAMCLPLVVARRASEDREAFFVIDGQHRLAAARLRGDIHQLPCVVAQFAGAASEARTFRALNTRRRPLSKLDLFKAAVASCDSTSVAIASAVADAGLTLAPHTKCASWKPGVVGAIGGIESSWRDHGEAATRLALQVLARAWPGEILNLAGTLFPGIAGICAEELKRSGAPIGADDLAEMLAEMLGAATQIQWRDDIIARRSECPTEKYAASSIAVLRAAWGELLAEFIDEAA